jgi:hypothetical protein
MAGTSQSREEFIHNVPRRLMGVAVIEGIEHFRLHFSHPQDPETMPVNELKVRISPSKLGEVFMNTEEVPADIRVVEEHNSPIRELGKPALKVMANGLVGMESVNMEQVDGSVAEAAQGFVKGAAQERGKLRVVGLVIGLNLLIDALVVVTGLIIPFPSVHSVRRSIETQPLDCLAE